MIFVIEATEDYVTAGIGCPRGTGRRGSSLLLAALRFTSQWRPSRPDGGDLVESQGGFQRSGRADDYQISMLRPDELEPHRQAVSTEAGTHSRRRRARHVEG